MEIRKLNNMMRRYTFVFSFAAALMWVMAACTDELLPSRDADSWQGNNKVTLSLKAAGVSRPDRSRAVDVPVDEGTDADYRISDFVVFQFDENGNRLVDPKYYDYVADAVNDAGQTIPVVLPVDDGVEYTVVVLANSHDQFANITFADATTLTKLMEKYQRFEKHEDSYGDNGSGYDLMMNGYATIDKNTSQIDMTLFRNVAKLTLVINNPSTSGVTLKSAQLRNAATKIDYFYHLIEDKNPGALTAPYPNYNNFTTFDYKADEFDVAPGDTKTLTYYLPCHLMGTSGSSTEKTKGNYAPDYATFVELYGISTDGKTFSRYRFYLGDNMVNDYNIKPNYHYTLPITFSSIGNQQSDPRVRLVPAIELEEYDANCYIINPLPTEEQTMYKIRAYKRINEFWENERIVGNIPTSTGYTIGRDDTWAVDVVWQSSNQQMIEFYDSNGDITENGGRVPPVYKDQVPLCFKPKKDARGNLVIGVYRTDRAENADRFKREYLWSWHLWITDYNPDECENQNWEGRYKYILSNGSGEVQHFVGTVWDSDNAKYHNKWVMDRNLGALSNNELGSFSQVMFYYYGRHVPNSATTVYYYDNASDSYKTGAQKNSSYGSTVTFHEFVKKPYMIYGGGHWNYYGSNSNMKYGQNIWHNPGWNQKAFSKKIEKSFFDPCPPGWCVTHSSVWSNIVSYVEGTSDGMYLYYDKQRGSANRAYFPATGYKYGDALRSTGNGGQRVFISLTDVYSGFPYGSYFLSAALTSTKLSTSVRSGGSWESSQSTMFPIRAVQCEDPYVVE